MINATQILRTMRDSIYPSSAEVSDLGNSILDGADSLMLSSDLGSAMDPVNTLKFCVKMCLEAEKW